MGWRAAIPVGLCVGEAIGPDLVGCLVDQPSGSGLVGLQNLPEFGQKKGLKMGLCSWAEISNGPGPK